ncbi:MAG: hypothetical protein GX593_10825, partial [Actinomycetales bacterium]|nr:hypothetical protein [Actinomycetales bacterium]
MDDAVQPAPAPATRVPDASVSDGETLAGVSPDGGTQAGPRVGGSRGTTLPASLGRRLAATDDLPAPLLAVDLDAFDANARELLARADGRPLRLATKSVRVPALIERALAAGFEGLMTYSLAEALWWSTRTDDVLMGYPTVDRGALARLAGDPNARRTVTLMIDDVAHLDLIAEAMAAVTDRDMPPIRVCLDIDASLRVGPFHLGVRRSPLRTPEDAVTLARQATRRGIEVRGVMFYEAQVAGLPDTSPAVRLVKRASLAELLHRRGAVVAALEEVLGGSMLVNGGGTGSIAATALDATVTEITSGSGLLSPTLFDGYRTRPGQTPLRPAAFIGLDVLRRPADGYVTAFSGGYIASGPVGRSRAPRPVLPAGLRLTGNEGAGEV